MISELDGHYILSMGFRNVRIADPEKTLKELRLVDSKAQLQLLKANLIAGPEHLRFAARNAFHSFRGKNPRSKSLAVEYLLYLSCQRQILKAIQMLGVGPTDNEVVLVALSDSRDALQELENASRSLLGEPDEKIVEIGSKRKLARIERSYDISKREIEAARFEGENDDNVVKRLVVERSALLDLEH